MRYSTTHSLPPTPPEDCDDPLSLIHPIAGLSLDLGLSNSSAWTPAFSSISSPPSYDPMSPSYDFFAASPCNPFPSSSPFTTFTFSRPRAGSKLRSEGAYNLGTSEVTPSPSPQPDTQSPPEHLWHTAALSSIPPPHSAPSLRRTKPCRFYLDPTGCKSGKWCNFKHPVGARTEDCLSQENSSLEELRAAVVRSRAVNSALNGDTQAWDKVSDVRDVDPNWGKKSEDEVHPKWRTQPCRNFLLGLCRYGDKCQFIHAPGLFPPTASESYPTSHPPLALSAEIHTAISPSLPLPVPVSVWGAHPGVGIVSGICPEGSSSSKPEQMSLYYRTKPCKYFDNDGTCPHGADCKFIHNPKKSALTAVAPNPVSPLPVVPGPSWADDDRELNFEETPCFSGMDVDIEGSASEDETAMQDMTNDGAYRSSSMKRRDRARARNASRDGGKGGGTETQKSGGIFKPLWRVVGGGVMLASGEERVPRNVIKSDEDEDAVLDYQPHDLEIHPITPALPDDSPVDYSYARSPFHIDTISPAPLSADDYDYTSFFIDPTQYPPNELLRAPSPDAGLEITMGTIKMWDSSPARLAPRKKRLITGADLMRGILDDNAQDGQIESRRVASPQKEKERQKPRLTIAVPGPTHTNTHRRTHSHGVKGSAGFTPYLYPQPRRAVVAESKLAARTDVGDDVLDWGSDDDEMDYDDKAGAHGNENGTLEAVGEDIRRVRSTPPTPRSKSYLDVPIIPRLPAESP